MRCKPQTFYYYFRNIYALAEWHFLNEAAQVLEDKRTYATWQKAFLQIFAWVLDNRQVVENIYRPVNREQLENYLYAIIYDLLIVVVDEMASGIADFYKSAFVFGYHQQLLVDYVWPFICSLMYHAVLVW